MPISDSMYDKSSIKLGAKIEKLSDDIDTAIKEQAAATNGISDTIRELTVAVRELTVTINNFYNKSDG